MRARLSAPARATARPTPTLALRKNASAAKPSAPSFSQKNFTKASVFTAFSAKASVSRRYFATAPPSGSGGAGRTGPVKKPSPATSAAAAAARASQKPGGALDPALFNSMREMMSKTNTPEFQELSKKFENDPHFQKLVNDTVGKAGPGKANPLSARSAMPTATKSKALPATVTNSRRGPQEEEEEEQQTEEDDANGLRGLPRFMAAIDQVVQDVSQSNDLSDQFSTVLNQAGWTYDLAERKFRRQPNSKQLITVTILTLEELTEQQRDYWNESEASDMQENQEQSEEDQQLAVPIHIEISRNDRPEVFELYSVVAKGALDIKSLAFGVPGRENEKMKLQYYEMREEVSEGLIAYLESLRVDGELAGIIEIGALAYYDTRSANIFRLVKDWVVPEDAETKDQ